MCGHLPQGYYCMTEDQQNELYEKLINCGFNNIQITNNNITCHFLLKDTDVKIFCELSDCFPYELPAVFIDAESYKNFAPLPHINHDLSICTFDRTVCLPNFQYPVQVITAAICQARKTLQEGVSGDSRTEFFSEIDAYWQSECTQYADSIVTTNDAIKTVKLFWGTKRVYLADTKQSLDHYLTNIGIRKRLQKDFFDCLYLPLSIKLTPPFPSTNLTLFKLLQTDPSVRDVYKTFIQKHVSSGAFVLTATPNENTKCLQLWYHTPASESVPGFRKGHAPANIAYLYDAHQRPVVKLAVTNMISSAAC